MEWEVLLMRIEARRVVPVIGPDLVLVTPSPEDRRAWEAPDPEDDAAPGSASPASQGGAISSPVGNGNAGASPALQSGAVARSAGEGDAGASPKNPDAWKVPDGPMTIESYLAWRLADEWRKSRKTPKISPRDLPPNPRLNDFVCRYLDRKGPREGLDQFYAHVAALFARTVIVTDPTADLPAGSIRLPETLRQLAEITDFNLFLTTVGDTLLEGVIRAVRTNAQLVWPSPGFSNENPLDLPADVGTERAPVVYHLFGQFGVEARSFALTEDDLLDYVVSLQTRSHSLGRLTDALKANQLLLLGSGFPDWLTRFVMRTAKPRLFHAEDVLADDVAARDDSLRLFLQRFSPKTAVMPGGGAAFVATLQKQWLDRRKQIARGQRVAETPLAEVMPPKVAFISYASENRDFARRLRAALKDAGVEAWYDQEQLEAGDNWDAKIRLNVQRCLLFLPLISSNTEARPEGYFRREWKAAALRSESIDESMPFILPLLLDAGLPQSTVQRVPKEFRVPQWGRCEAGGGVPESYLAQVKNAFQVWGTPS